jgi:hypothetical protein
MRTAVDKVHKGKGRTVNARFAVMCAHCLCDPDFCNVASGWEKGRVEKNVQDNRRRIWIEAVRHRFGSEQSLPLPYRGDRQRKPPLLAQQRFGEEAHQGQGAGPQGQRQGRFHGRHRLAPPRVARRCGLRPSRLGTRIHRHDQADKLATWLAIEATQIAETAAQSAADPHTLCRCKMHLLW